MKDNDQNLLEEAYSNILKEMAYRPLMPYYSKKPSIEKVSNRPKTESEYEERKVKAGLKINENLGQLQSNSNELKPAYDIINIMNNFVDKSNQQEIEREDFLVGDEELSYVDVLKLILDFVKTKENNPELIMKSTNEYGEEVGGLTVDEYVKGDPTKRRTADHYYLFRLILDSLPDIKTQKRSRRETELGEEKQTVPLFYFAEKHDVYYSGEHIGYLNQGKLFWPTERGKELKFEEIGTGKWRNFFAKHRGEITLENRRLEPFITHTFDNGRPITGFLFPASNRRRPRRESEPQQAPAPWPYNEYQPKELQNKTLDEVKILLKSDEAEKKFKDLYPEQDFPLVYKKGKTSGTINAPEI
jgi:hypothetical protein